MKSIQDWIQQVLPGNTVMGLIWFMIILLSCLFLRRILAQLISRLFYQLFRREIHGVPISDFLRLMRPPIETLILLVLIYIAFSQLTIPANWDIEQGNRFGLRMVLRLGYQTVILGTLTWLGVRAVKVMALFFQKRVALSDNKPVSQLVPFLRDLIILFVCLIGLFTTLDLVYDVNVLALVTSLGIGGLAIALAARETLENLFASFAILLDRPFVSGDTISISGIHGSVEQIGFRSTRIRTDDDSLVSVPNRLMLNQSLENQTQRRSRRVHFYVRLAYDIPPELMRTIITDIQQLIDTHSLTQVQEHSKYARFETFGESSLDILVVYYVATTDGMIYQKTREEINFSIAELVHRHGARFAFPTRTLYLHDLPQKAQDY